MPSLGPRSSFHSFKIDEQRTASEREKERKSQSMCGKQRARASITAIALAIRESPSSSIRFRDVLLRALSVALHARETGHVVQIRENKPGHDEKEGRRSKIEMERVRDRK